MKNKLTTETKITILLKKERTQKVVYQEASAYNLIPLQIYIYIYILGAVLSAFFSYRFGGILG